MGWLALASAKVALFTLASFERERHFEECEREREHKFEDRERCPKERLLTRSRSSLNFRRKLTKSYPASSLNALLGGFAAHSTFVALIQRWIAENKSKNVQKVT